MQKAFAFARPDSGWFDFSRSGCPENLITNNVLVVTIFPRPVGWGALREGPQCRHWGRGRAAWQVGRKGQGKDRALQ